MSNLLAEKPYIKKIIFYLIIIFVLLPFSSREKEEAYTIYVSAGAEQGDGSEDKPFGSLDEARLAIRDLGTKRWNYKSIIVEVDDGQYDVKSLIFEKGDSGLEKFPIIFKAKNPGKAILNGGVKLDSSTFSHTIDPEIKSRLSNEVAGKIVCLSLFDLGITPDDYGKIGAIGSYNTASRYEGDWIQDQYCELFYNDNRAKIARYPNEGFVVTDEVVSEEYQSIAQGGDVYKLSQELTDRVSSWKTTDDIWMYGYWSYDWADASTPIGFFDAKECILSPKFAAIYPPGEQNARFFFFNVLEELDTPGEWYLDRKNGMLYLYPYDDFANAEIILSLSIEPIIKSSGVKFLTFDGFVIEGTRGNGVELTGDNITVSNCLIKNVGGNALLMTGNNNLAYNNEICRTGKGGIILEGGNREKLTPGNNVADNNLIHDWSEIYYTYLPAVRLIGVGNVCQHNEIYNSPHVAITFAGNNHVIQFNEVHDVCKLSSDTGAIYASRHWDYYGTKISYNYIYDLGMDKLKPNGIYLDDNLSGITVFGNIVVNTKGSGLFFGGGRDLDAENNLIVSCKTSITYDSRGLRGSRDEEHWYANNLPTVWESLYQSPWESIIWKKAYPQMIHFTDDRSDLDNPNFVPNPANSVVINNVEYKCGPSSIAWEVFDFSKIELYDDPMEALEEIEDEIFVDEENGDYHIRKDVEEIVFDDPNLQPIPFGEIGRQ